MKSEHALPEIKLFRELGTGTVEETIAPNKPGRVKYQATFWPARFYHQDEQAALVPDKPVYVVGRQGLTLLVVPVGNDVALT